ncbi:CPSF A subunit region-domain-containing protein [Mycena latifolia]|nr:CPSF A subunit region-domain-containing protein [Mycena latifolia]
MSDLGDSLADGCSKFRRKFGEPGEVCLWDNKGVSFPERQDIYSNFRNGSRLNPRVQTEDGDDQVILKNAVDMEVDPQVISIAQASESQIENTATVAEEPVLPKKKEKREPAKVERPPGKTLLPVSKVQHIIKLTRILPSSRKKRHFSYVCGGGIYQAIRGSGHGLGRAEKRTTLQYKDIATVVRKADEFLFLEEIIPWTMPEAPVKRKVKESNMVATGVAPTLLDQFMVKPHGGSGDEPQIIFNEDGCAKILTTSSSFAPHLAAANELVACVSLLHPKASSTQCRWDGWGNILSVKSVPTGLIFLTYAESTLTGSVLNTTKRLELLENNQRPAEFFNDVIVHPGGKLAIVSCYTGKLKGVVLNAGNYKDDFDASKQKNKRRKLEKEKDTAEVEKKQKEAIQRKRKPKAFVDWPWSEITSFCALDGQPLRYLIGDCFGRLCMLSLHGRTKQRPVLIPLGDTSPPTTLTYLANQVLYVGSHAGDSQLVQISSTPLSSSDETPTLPIPLEIKTVLPGTSGPALRKRQGQGGVLEPLRDCVLDGKGSLRKGLRITADTNKLLRVQEARIPDPINVMRKGADFQQLATASGMAHTTWCFSSSKNLRRFVRQLCPHLYSFKDTHASEMRGTDKLEPIGVYRHWICAGSYPAARNVQRAKFKTGGRARQHDICARNNGILWNRTGDSSNFEGCLSLEFDMLSFTQVDNYDVASRGNSRELQVVAASLNPTQAILALNTGKLLCLEVNKDTNTLDLKRESTGYPSASEFVVVSYWQTNEIEVLLQGSNNFLSVCKTKPLGAVVRSLLLHDFGTGNGDSHPYLFAGLGDGSFVYFAWNKQERVLGEPKLASLGNLPVCFTPCSVDGKKALFAAGSRAMVLSWERDRIHNSPVVLKEVRAAAQIHNEHYETSLILANEFALFIGRVRDVDEMHIRSIPLGLDVPQRIVYEPSLKVFGVACTRREPTRIGAPEPAPRSSFRLLDDTTFNHISQYNCDTDEEITCVTTLTLEMDNESIAFFCLGTYMFHSDESVPGEGRLLVFNAYPPGTHSRSSHVELSLATSKHVEGCVYSVTTVNGLIAAGVNSAVMLFRLEMDPVSKACKLQKVSMINLNYFVTSLSGYDNRLVLGDQISSVSLLEISEDSKLRSLGRDLTPLSPVCVQALDGNHIVAANESRKLDRDGFYQQSDLVTKFVRGKYKRSITASDAGSKLEPVQMFFASSGRIGVIVDINDRQLGLDLTELQRNMVAAIEGAQGHNKFRTPQSTARRKNKETAYGFLDGDFLERLLVTPPAQLAKVVAGTSEPERLKRPLHEIQQLLKSLQSLH